MSGIPPSNGPKAIWLAGIPAAYFVTASISILFTRFNGGLALAWPATGVLLAFLCLHKGRLPWPLLSGCFAVSVVATSLFGLGPAAAFPMGIVNIGEALLTLLLLRRLRAQGDYFESLSGLSVFVVLAGFVAPGLAGLPGAAIASATTGNPFAQQWIAWIAGHGLGTVLTMPIALLIARGEVNDWVRTSGVRASLEAAFLLGTVWLAAWATFAQDTFPLLFLPLLPMMFATCRLGRFGASASTLILAWVAGSLSWSGSGPVAAFGANLADRAQYLQFYLATALLLVLPVAAVLKEKNILLLKLKEEEALHRILTENSGDIMLSLRTDGTIRFVSPSVQETLGFDPDDIVGRNIADFVAQRDLASLLDARMRAIADPGRTTILETRMSPVPGFTLWLETKLRAVKGEGGSVIGLVCSVRDVSNRKAAERELTRAAFTDPLTGLGNRRTFFSALEKAVQSAGGDPVFLAILDIDHFKLVNDQHGHAVGDAVLRAVARIGSGLIGADDLMTRIGGEEFALLMKGADMEQAALLCERIRTAILGEGIATPRETAISVSISLGLTRIAPGDTTETAMRAADDALYRAKRAGRNQLQIAA